jgi:hypothetical protein
MHVTTSKKEKCWHVSALPHDLIVRASTSDRATTAKYDVMKFNTTEIPPISHEKQDFQVNYFTVWESYCLNF